MAARISRILLACLALGAGFSRPPATEPIAALNANARRMRCLRCDRVAVDCSQDGKAIGLDGILIARYPLDFRLHLKAGGMDLLDLGSNAKEAWCWIGKAEPPWVLRSSHRDLTLGRTTFPIPGDTAWLLQVLGVGEYAPPQRYTVAERNGLMELVQKTKEPDGSHLRRITVVQRKGKSYEPVAYRLENAQGKVLCRVRILERSKDKDTGAVLPKKLTFEWPPHRTKMELDLFDSRVVPSLDPEKAKRYFTPPEKP